MFSISYYLKLINAMLNKMFCKTIGKNHIIVSQGEGVHLALVLYYRGVVHSLDIHLVGERQLAPEEDNILLPVLP